MNTDERPPIVRENDLLIHTAKNSLQEIHALLARHYELLEQRLSRAATTGANIASQIEQGRQDMALLLAFGQYLPQQRGRIRQTRYWENNLPYLEQDAVSVLVPKSDPSTQVMTAKIVQARALLCEAAPFREPNFHSEGQTTLAYTVGHRPYDAANTLLLLLTPPTVDEIYDTRTGFRNAVSTTPRLLTVKVPNHVFSAWQAYSDHVLHTDFTDDQLGSMLAAGQGQYELPTSEVQPLTLGMHGDRSKAMGSIAAKGISTTVSPKGRWSFLTGRVEIASPQIVQPSEFIDGLAGWSVFPYINDLAVAIGAHDQLRMLIEDRIAQLDTVGPKE